MTTQEKEIERKPFAIVCVKAYEFEGIEFKVGDISDSSFGRNIPDGWRKATQKDIDNYINSTHLNNNRMTISEAKLLVERGVEIENLKSVLIKCREFLIDDGHRIDNSSLMIDIEKSLAIEPVAYPLPATNKEGGEAQEFEKHPRLANIIEWFANNVLAPSTAWNKLLHEINTALASPSRPDAGVLAKGVERLMAYIQRRHDDLNSIKRTEYGNGSHHELDFIIHTYFPAITTALAGLSSSTGREVEMQGEIIRMVSHTHSDRYHITIEICGQENYIGNHIKTGDTLVVAKSPQ